MSGGARRETYPGRNKPTGRAPRRERGSARLPHRSQPAASRYRRACPLQAPSWSVQHERRVARQVKDDVDIGIRDQLGHRRIGCWQSVQLSLAPRLLEIASRACDDAHDVIGFEIADIDVADIANTKDANIKRFHRRGLLS